MDTLGSFQSFSACKWKSSGLKAEAQVHQGSSYPQGVEAKPLAQQELPSVTLWFVAPLSFSPLPVETLVGFAASLPTDSKKNPQIALHACAVGLLGAGTGVVTPSYSQQALAPRPALARLSPCR